MSGLPAHESHPVTVRMTDCEVWFGDVCAVGGVDLEVAAGERLAILGVTGSGKSTILNLLTGVRPPDRGTVEVVGRDPSTHWRDLQGRVAMAFQTPGLLPWRTALENVMLGPQILGLEVEERRERAVLWMERVKLEHALDRYPAQLSGGMRQRVSLARALVIEPQVLLLDEAFSALDEVTAVELRGDFVEAWGERPNSTVVMVTHNINEALDIAHRVIVVSAPARIIGEFRIAEPGRAGSGLSASERDEHRKEILGLLAR